MPQQFLVRNRHQNTWYGRVIIPSSLRLRFNGKRELRKSLGVSDKRQAKFLSTQFWVQCQEGFAQLSTRSDASPSFTNTDGFLSWLSENTEQHGFEAMKKRPVTGNLITRMRQETIGALSTITMSDTLEVISITDAMGNTHTVDLNDPEREATLSLALQKQSAELLNQAIDRYKDQPEVLASILGQNKVAQPVMANSSIPCEEAIDQYIQKLEAQGRKGKRLAPRTLVQYRDKLKFWAGCFKGRMIHEITLQELNDIQNWLTRLPASFAKKGMSVEQAIWGNKCGIAAHHAEVDNSPELEAIRIRIEQLQRELNELKALLERSET